MRRARFGLSSKVLLLALLNLVLLVAVFALLARVQFRLDPGSFLLAPAQSRIIAAAHTIALELEDMPQEAWDAALAREARVHGVEMMLLDQNGERVAGPELRMPPDIADRVPRHQRPRGGPPPDREAKRQRRAAGGGGAPALFLTATSSPTRYWAGVRVPVRRDPEENPKPGTLVMVSGSLLSSDLYFDPKPWLTVALAIILVSIACWLPFIRGVTRSVSEMTRAAGQIAEGHFDVAVSERRRDEIGQLGAAINRMAARLSGFVNGQKRFLAGVAHELCNPLATIQFALGNLDRRVEEEHRPAVAGIQEEAEQMSRLVDELLSFSRAGMAGVEPKLVEVNLASVVSRAIERESQAGARIQVAVDSDLVATADAEHLFRAVSNVLRNAIRYAGPAGPIEIAARAASGRVFLTIGDHGPGVPPEALDAIFAPFYRVDDSRNQETGGVGMGLAIVKSCIDACQGTVRCRNRIPQGLEIEIELAARRVS